MMHSRVTIVARHLNPLTTPALFESSRVVIEIVLTVFCGGPQFKNPYTYIHYRMSPKHGAAWSAGAQKFAHFTFVSTGDKRGRKCPRKLCGPMRGLCASSPKGQIRRLCTASLSKQRFSSALDRARLAQRHPHRCILERKFSQACLYSYLFCGRLLKALATPDCQGEREIDSIP